MQAVKHRFAFCALTAFAALAASATDYYVATTGSDESDGLTAETASRRPTSPAIRASSAARSTSAATSCRRTPACC